MVYSFREQTWTAYIIRGPSPVAIGETRSYTVSLQDGPSPSPPDDDDGPYGVGYSWGTTNDSVLDVAGGSSFKGVSQGTATVFYRKYYYPLDDPTRKTTLLQGNKTVTVINPDSGDYTYPLIVRHKNGMVVGKEYTWGMKTLPESSATINNINTSLLEYTGSTNKVLTKETGSETANISKSNFSFPIHYTIVSKEEPSVGFSGVPLVMILGSTLNISAFKFGGPSFSDYEYSSSSESRIEVIDPSKGRIKAVGIGTAKIKAFDKVSQVEGVVDIQVVASSDNYLNMIYTSLLKKGVDYTIRPFTIGEEEDTSYTIESSNNDILQVSGSGSEYKLETQDKVGFVEVNIRGNDTGIRRSVRLAVFDDDPCVINVDGNLTFEAGTETELSATTLGFPESDDYEEAESYIWSTNDGWLELEGDSEEEGETSESTDEDEDEPSRFKQVSGKTCKVKSKFCNMLGTITVRGKKSFGEHTFNVMAVGHPLSYIEVNAPSGMKECRGSTNISTVIRNTSVQDEEINLDWTISSGEVWEGKYYPGEMGVTPTNVSFSVTGKESCASSRGNTTNITVYPGLKYRRTCYCSAAQASMSINTVNNDGAMNILGPNAVSYKKPSGFQLVESGDITLKDIGWFSPDNVEFSNPTGENTEITSNALGLQRIGVSARGEDCDGEYAPPTFISQFRVNCLHDDDRFIILSGTQTIFRDEESVDVEITKHNLENDETGNFVSHSVDSTNCDATIEGNSIKVFNIDFSKDYVEVEYTFKRENFIENEPPNPPVTQEIDYVSIYRANIAGVGVAIEGSNFIEQDNSKSYSSVLYGFGGGSPDSYEWTISGQAEISGGTTSSTVSVKANEDAFGTATLNLTVSKDDSDYSTSFNIYIGRLAKSYEEMIINLSEAESIALDSWHTISASNRVEKFDEEIKITMSGAEVQQRERFSAEVRPYSTGVKTVTAKGKPSGRSSTWKVYVYNPDGGSSAPPDGMNPDDRNVNAPLRIYETNYRSVYMLGDCQKITTEQLGHDCELEWDSDFTIGQMSPNIIVENNEEDEHRDELQFKGLPNALWRGTTVGPIHSAPLKLVQGTYEVTKPSHMRLGEAGCGGACDDGNDDCDDSPWDIPKLLEEFVYNCGCCLEMMGPPPKLPRIMPDDDWSDIGSKFGTWVAFYNSLCANDCTGWIPECDPPEPGSCPGLVCPHTYTWTEDFEMQVFYDFIESINSLCCLNICGTCKTKYTLTISGLETCPSEPRPDFPAMCGDPDCYSGDLPEGLEGMRSWGSISNYNIGPYRRVGASPLEDGSQLNDVYDMYWTGGCSFRPRNGRCDTENNPANDLVWGGRRNTCPSDYWCVEWSEVPPGSGDWECTKCEDMRQDYEIEGYLSGGGGRFVIGVWISLNVGSKIRVSIRWNSGWGDPGIIFDAEVELERTDAGVYVLNSPKTAPNENLVIWSLPEELCKYGSPGIDWVIRLGLNGTMTVAPAE